MRYSLTIACTTPGCPAYLTVPRADADKYAKAFTCQRCQDDAMAEHYLSLNQQPVATQEPTHHEKH